MLQIYNKTPVVGISTLICCAYRSTAMPPSSKVCENPTDIPVTALVFKLSDGRCLAYKERGVPKDAAKYKVIVVHGYDSSKDVYLPLSQEFIENHGLYIVTFDRPGYGESDPNPKRTVKSDTFDVQELADHLTLGSKFYVVGVSLGNYISWGFLKYLPHRLAGAALVVPVINYWWPSFPPEMVTKAFKMLPKRDQIKLWIAHHAPTLNKARQQGENESLYRDLKVGFGKWEFDPMEVECPFQGKQGGVHLWQGYEDRLIPYKLQRFVASKLGWIEYHEVPYGGHLIIHDNVLCEEIFQSLLLG
ncbi:hypothetical protein RND81_05G251100 [Saponaria officinalis]|uniref:AB hydrolase-1 domain-containing protein n=1 Tax=Saponaria officinalis TaxID=3572 RepID=A0AAW1L1K5_SAPOF